MTNFNFDLLRFENIPNSDLIENPIIKSQIESTRHSLLSHSLKISNETVPKVFKLIEECALKLELEVSQIESYVYSKPDYNAFSISQTNHKILIAFSSSLIKILNNEEMKFLIGHELGHAIFDHSESTHLIDQQQTNTKIASLREMEISADRIGFLCCNSLENSITSMMKMASGLDNDFINTDIRPFLDQNISINDLANKLDDSISSHPPLPLRAKALVWLSTLNIPSNMITTFHSNAANIEKIKSINGEIRIDLQNYFEAAKNKSFNEEADFLKLILLTMKFSDDSLLTKSEQSVIVDECGTDAIKLFEILKKLNKNEAKKWLTNKSNDSVKKLMQIDRDKCLETLKNYQKQFDISNGPKF